MSQLTSWIKQEGEREREREKEGKRERERERSLTVPFKGTSLMT
jgi:hypothetical protein